MRAPAPLRFAVPVLAALTAWIAAPGPARALVVERVVAVVGDRPILKSDLEKRARPFLRQALRHVPPGPQYAAAESQILKELMGKLVDEELESQAAEKAHVTVTVDEVDNAMRNVAQAQGMSLADFLNEARARSGMSEQDYRDEIRRQILEGKMLQARVKGRVRITEEDVKAMYERQLREERKRREYRPAWIVLRIAPGSSAAAVAERRALATQLAQRARKGEDFASLARSYSDDATTREQGGDLGIRAPAGSQQAAGGRRPVLAPDFEAATIALEPGQIADPIEIAGTLVILQLQSRGPSRYTTYEASKGEMVQRLQQEILEKAKRKWLDELKARTHLDVRL